jgi:hypothetical protein
MCRHFLWVTIMANNVDKIRKKKEQDTKNMMFLALENVETMTITMENTNLEPLKPALDRVLYELSNINQMMQALSTD